MSRAMLDAVELEPTGPRRIGRLASYDGLMLEATGFPMPVGSNARVIDADGHAALAEVVGFRGNRTLLMALDADAPHSAGARVEPDRRGGSVDVGDTLLGRVIDALGNPIDGLGPIGIRRMRNTIVAICIRIDMERAPLARPMTMRAEQSGFPVPMRIAVVGIGLRAGFRVTRKRYFSAEGNRAPALFGRPRRATPRA